MQLSHGSFFLSPLVHTNEVQGMQQASCLRLLARRARNLLEEAREVLAKRAILAMSPSRLASRCIPMHHALAKEDPLLGMLAAFTSSSTKSRWENHSECFARGAQAIKTAMPEPSQTEEPRSYLYRCNRYMVGRDWCWVHGPSMVSDQCL